MNASDWIAALSALASAVSAACAAYAALQVRRQIVTADRANEAAVFLQIYEAWNGIYPRYREMLGEPFLLADALAGDPSFDQYARTAEWQRMRPVFAFHEFLGALVRQGLVRENTLFSLVSVGPELWRKYGPLILHFRDRSERWHLYVAWEELVERHAQYTPGLEHLPLRRPGRGAGR